MRSDEIKKCKLLLNEYRELVQEMIDCIANEEGDTTLSGKLEKVLFGEVENG